MLGFNNTGIVQGSFLAITQSRVSVRYAFPGPLQSAPIAILLTVFDGSEVLEATQELRSRAMEGCGVSSKSPKRVQDQDNLSTV